MSRDVEGVEEGDVLGVRYESVYGSTAAEHTAVVSATDAGHHVEGEDQSGEAVELRTDGDVAIEVATPDKYGHTQRVGYVAEVTRMGWTN